MNFIIRWINNLRGRVYCRKDKKSILFSPKELFREFTQEVAGKYPFHTVYNMGNKNSFYHYVLKGLFYFDAGWCTAWPETSGIFKEDMISHNSEWLQMNNEVLDTPEVGWYWDDEKQERINVTRSIGVPYIQSTTLYKPPYSIGIHCKVNVSHGLWIAPIWLHMPSDDKNNYQEIDAMEVWYEGKKSDKRAKISLHYSKNGKRKMISSYVRFAEPHEEREIFIRIDLTKKDLRMSYDGQLVFKTKKHLPKNAASFICSSTALPLGLQNDNLDLMCAMPGKFEIKSICVASSYEIINENKTRDTDKPDRWPGYKKYKS